ncbi:MAG: PH domain-containing protein [Clostridia bacterium]|jgi:uncharacterized membrane protein YdbT with pleckstrin-like domain|nr:PH domain-containing protein [Clostridia bacterium]
MEAENVVWEARPSNKLYLIDLLMGVAAFILEAVMILGAGVLLNYEENFKPYLKLSMMEIIGIFFAISFVVIVLKMFRVMIEINSVHYKLTNERMILKRGILNVTTDNLELYRIKDIAISQPFELKLFNIANVILHTSDETTPVLKIASIDNYEEVMDMFRSNIEEVRAHRIIETSVIEKGQG